MAKKITPHQIWHEAAQRAHASATRHFADALVADGVARQALLWLASEASASATRFEQLAIKFAPKG